MKENETCSHIGYANFTPNKCRNKAKYDVDGKHYCGVHNPNKAPTKAQIEAAMKDKKCAAERRRSAAIMRLYDRMLANNEPRAMDIDKEYQSALK